MAGEDRRIRRKICPNATFSTTNSTWTDLGLNPGLRSEKPANGRLTYSIPSPRLKAPMAKSELQLAHAYRRFLCACSK